MGLKWAPFLSRPIMGFIRRGRDPPTKPSRHLKKEMSDSLSSGCSTKIGEEDQPPLPPPPPLHAVVPLPRPPPPRPPPRPLPLLASITHYLGGSPPKPPLPPPPHAAATAQVCCASTTPPPPTSNVLLPSSSPPSTNHAPPPSLHFSGSRSASSPSPDFLPPTLPPDSPPFPISRFPQTSRPTARSSAAVDETKSYGR